MRKQALFSLRAVGSWQRREDAIYCLKDLRRRKEGKTGILCRMLSVSRQGFYDYLEAKNQPWKYQEIAEAMKGIRAEDVCNDTYGRTRMRIALTQRLPAGKRIPCEGTIQKIMAKTGLVHSKRRKPNGITKSERNARKYENIIQRDFSAGKPCQKCITDITEIKGSNGKLYVSGIFDCFDIAALGLAMDIHMKALSTQAKITEKQSTSMGSARA